MTWFSLPPGDTSRQGQWPPPSAQDYMCVAVSNCSRFGGFLLHFMDSSTFQFRVYIFTGTCRLQGGNVPMPQQAGANSVQRCGAQPAGQDLAKHNPFLAWPKQNKTFTRERGNYKCCQKISMLFFPSSRVFHSQRCRLQGNTELDSAARREAMSVLERDFPASV